MIRRVAVPLLVFTWVVAMAPWVAVPSDQKILNITPAVLVDPPEGIAISLPEFRWLPKGDAQGYIVNLKFLTGTGTVYKGSETQKTSQRIQDGFPRLDLVRLPEEGVRVVWWVTSLYKDEEGKIVFKQESDHQSLVLLPAPPGYDRPSADVEPSSKKPPVTAKPPPSRESKQETSGVAPVVLVGPWENTSVSLPEFRWLSRGEARAYVVNLQFPTGAVYKGCETRKTTQRVQDGFPQLNLNSIPKEGIHVVWWVTSLHKGDGSQVLLKQDSNRQSFTLLPASRVSGGEKRSVEGIDKKRVASAPAPTAKKKTVNVTAADLLGPLEEAAVFLPEFRWQGGGDANAYMVNLKFPMGNVYKGLVTQKTTQSMQEGFPKLDFGRIPKEGIRVVWWVTSLCVDEKGKALFKKESFRQPFALLPIPDVQGQWECDGGVNDKGEHLVATMILTQKGSELTFVHYWTGNGQIEEPIERRTGQITEKGIFVESPKGPVELILVSSGKQLKMVAGGEVFTYILKEKKKK